MRLVSLILLISWTAGLAYGQDRRDLWLYPQWPYTPYYSYAPYGYGGTPGQAAVIGLANGLTQGLLMRQEYEFQSRLMYEQYQYQLQLLREQARQQRLENEREEP